MKLFYVLIICIIILLITNFRVCSQINTSLGCAMEEYIDPSVLDGTITPVPRRDVLNTYLSDVQRDAFGITYRTNIKIQKTSRAKVALSHVIDADGREVNYDRMITVNNAYFESLFSGSEEKRAVMIFIIAHEYAHHARGDIFKTKNGLFSNLEHEILADERGGYAVGKLTENIDDTFFDSAIPKFLESTLFTSTHPSRDFRIMAAKAGFALAKLEKHDTVEVKVNQRTYTRKNYTNGYDYIINNNLKYTIYNKDNFEIIYLNSERINDGGAIQYFDGEDSGSDTDSRQIFFGNYDKGRVTGKGYRVWVNNDSYLGEYLDNIPHGEGRLINSNGTYTGNFINGKQEGFGKYISKDGIEYEGTWLNGNRVEGVMTYGNGVYTGSFINDKREGHGKYQWKDGSVYVGNWKNDRQHGKGFYKGVDKAIMEGCWNMGEYVYQNCPQ